jgi:hypothetical protein
MVLVDGDAGSVTELEPAPEASGQPRSQATPGDAKRP